MQKFSQTNLPSCRRDRERFRLLQPSDPPIVVAVYHYQPRLDCISICDSESEKCKSILNKLKQFTLHAEAFVETFVLDVCDELKMPLIRLICAWNGKRKLRADTVGPLLNIDLHLAIVNSLLEHNVYGSAAHQCSRKSKHALRYQKLLLGGRLALKLELSRLADTNRLRALEEFG